MQTPSARTRCPKCNALVDVSVRECPECKLLSQFPQEHPCETDEPRNPLGRFVWGLGIPLDIWIILVLGLLWFVIILFAKSLSLAFFWALIGFGLPLLIVLSSEYLSTISFVRVPLEDIDSIAVKLLAWIYMIGIQGWLIFDLVYQWFAV